MDAYAIITLHDSTRYKEEFYYGDGYLSQSSRHLKTDERMKHIEIVQYNGLKRSLK